ncbi:Uncharacterised protein [Vibrio cholerae]|nr:Uncharacterised protein [Vibrio cholerae]CSI55897.1 Uncharacterised protein [Vibrio cholerae]
MHHGHHKDKQRRSVALRLALQVRVCCAIFLRVVPIH